MTFSTPAQTNASAMPKRENPRREDLRVLICTSPKAGTGGGREGIAHLVEALKALNIPTEVTTDIKRVRDVSGFGDPSFPHSREPSHVIVSAGGDGTLALIAQNTPPSTVLMPMPLGTENLLAKHFGFSCQTDAMIDTLLNGCDTALDAGSANGKIFLVMATCGFDAEVVRAMHLRRRGHINRFSYAGPIVRTLRHYRFPPLNVTWFSAEEALQESNSDHEAPHYHECRWAMVFNLPRYAASLPIEREACGDDGKLNFYGLKSGSVASGLRYLGGIVTGRHIHWSDVFRQSITGCRITSPESVSYQLDGDYAGRLPLEIRVLPQYIQLRLPPTRPLDRS